MLQATGLMPAPKSRSGPSTNEKPRNLKNKGKRKGDAPSQSTANNPKRQKGEVKPDPDEDDEKMLQVNLIHEPDSDHTHEAYSGANRSFTTTHGCGEGC